MSADIPNRPRRIAPQHGPSRDHQEQNEPRSIAGRLSHQQIGVLPQGPKQVAEPLTSGAWSALPLGIPMPQGIDDGSRSELNLLKSMIATGVILLAVGAAAALTVQFIGVLTTIYESPPWLQIPAICLLTVVAIALFWAGGRYWQIYRHFSTRQRVYGQKWRELREIQDAHATLTRRQKVQGLRHWLRAYSFSTSDRQSLLHMGMTTAQVAELAEQHKALQQPELDGLDANWQTAFREQFQKPLDSVATKLIQTQAKRAFWRAAVSPIPLLDSFLLLYGCLEMVTGICRIYQLRPSGFQSVTLLSEVILSAYGSAKLDEASDAVADSIGSNIGEALPTAADAAATIIGKLLGKAVATSAQGTLNAYFVYRIGMKTVQMVKPLAD